VSVQVIVCFPGFSVPCCIDHGRPPLTVVRRPLGHAGGTKPVQLECVVMEAAARPCVRCGRPVVAEADRYEIFERMHYVCFHYEFEHDPVDPDEECWAGGCPSAAIRPHPERRPENRR
jgi:hypothetical protein